MQNGPFGFLFEFGENVIDAIVEIQHGFHLESVENECDRFLIVVVVVVPSGPVHRA